MPALSEVLIVDPEVVVLRDEILQAVVSPHRTHKLL
jgi:hypothetical protein